MFTFRTRKQNGMLEFSSSAIRRRRRRRRRVVFEGQPLPFSCTMARIMLVLKGLIEPFRAL